MSRRLLHQLQLAHSRRCDRFFGKTRLSAGSRHRLNLIRQKMEAEMHRKDGNRIWGPRTHRMGCCVRTKEGFTREPMRDGMKAHEWNRRRPIVDFRRARLDDMIPF